MFAATRLFASAALVLVVARAANQQATSIPPALYSINASELKGDLSFLASDALQGRYTPSPQLDIAAEFIASRFREAGLKQGGDDGYFQTAHMIERTMPKPSSGLETSDAASSYTVPAGSIAVVRATHAIDVNHAPVLTFDGMDTSALKGVDLTGKAIVVHPPNFHEMPREQARKVSVQAHEFQEAIEKSSAALEIMVRPQPARPATQLLPATPEQQHSVPILAIPISEGERIRGTVSIEVPTPIDHPVVVRNVVGILAGSDAHLAGSYVLVTAHYDHVGTSDTSTGMANPASVQDANDHIYNGADDDASGTVSVIAIARALAKLNPRPKRSIVFMTFFGEERGELGSEYYVQHPVVPLQRTVADLNIEQVGRTDELQHGKVVPQMKSFNITGFDYSSMSQYLIAAGQQMGIKVVKDNEASDPYFTQSDNAAFAEQGIPAHTVSVAYDFPDYHGVGDEWQKIEYNNMARVDRALGLAVIRIANSASVPQWTKSNPKTAPFREAQAKLKEQ